MYLEAAPKPLSVSFDLALHRNAHHYDVKNDKAAFGKLKCCKKLKLYFIPQA